jgi:DNA polymerase (family 10)
MIDHNEIVKHLNRIAELKALDGANSFSVSAYQNAAKKIESTKKLDGIGPKTAATIQQFLKTGTSDIYEDLATRVPVECLTMTVVQGIGPKTAYAYWKDGIKNFDELVKAAEAKQLKPKVTKAVLFARDVGTGRIPRAEVHPVATAVVKAIRGIDGIVNAEVCGSFRRGRDTVKDLDIVVAINGYCSLGNDGPIDAQ